MISFCLTSAIEYQEKDNRLKLEEYILRMAQGDQDAIAGLFEHTKAAVYGFSLSILKNVQDAEDVLQDTYIRIYAAAGRYKPTGNPIPWIFTIVRNLSLMKIRERSRTEDVPEENWENLFQENPTMDAEEKIILPAAMEHLTDEERQIIMLHAVAGFKHREISQLLEIPLPTVLSKYHRALKKLKTILQESE